MLQQYVDLLSKCIEGLREFGVHGTIEEYFHAVVIEITLVALLVVPIFVIFLIIFSLFKIPQFVRFCLRNHMVNKVDALMDEWCSLEARLRDMVDLDYKNCHYRKLEDIPNDKALELLNDLKEFGIRREDTEGFETIQALANIYSKYKTVSRFNENIVYFIRPEGFKYRNYSHAVNSYDRSFWFLTITLYFLYVIFLLPLLLMFIPTV